MTTNPTPKIAIFGIKMAFLGIGFGIIRNLRKCVFFVFYPFWDRPFLNLCKPGTIRTVRI